ncbi:MAG: UPF0179 family protein [Thermoplasmata archaeon]|jgi:uncharacterized protein (UPF0179 family)|nr:UPF0179 family protein [Thermoplasmata archaeon]
MADITLISAAQAKPGFEFVYMGAAPICRTCPFRHACLTLDMGRRYKITKVRPVQHPCALQETTANVVEVAAMPRALVVESRSAVVGSSIEMGRFACSRVDCPNWNICAGPSLPPKQRFRIEKVDREPAECRIGRTLKRVEAV